MLINLDRFIGININVENVRMTYIIKQREYLKTKKKLCVLE